MKNLLDMTDSPALSHLTRFGPLVLFLLFLTAAAPAQVVPAGPFHTIIFVRHGAYDPNVKDPAASPLNALGIAQARLVAARLAGLPGRMDAIISSPFTRADQTARVIAAEMPDLRIQTLADIGECTPPSRRPETSPKTPAEAKESAACATRLDSVFAKIFVSASGKPRRTIVVAHGNVIRYLVTRLLGVDTKAWLEMSIAYASITKVLVEASGAFKVISIGDVGHLPPSMQSGTTGTQEQALVVP